MPEKGQRASRYRLADELFEAPQPEPTIHGPLWDGPPVPIRRAVSDTESPVTIPDAHFGVHQKSDAYPGVHQNSHTLTPVGVKNPAHKRNARALVGRLVGDNPQKNERPTYLPSDSQLLVAGLNLGDLLDALVHHDEKATLQDAVELAVRWRKEMPNVTQETIVHFVYVKGDEIRKGNNAHHPARVIATKSAEQYAGLRAQMYQNQQQRQREGREAAADEAAENQRQAEGHPDTSAARAAYREKERQAYARELADWLRQQAQWLMQNDLTKGHAERVEHIAQQVERFEPETLRLEDSLARIRSEIQATLYEASSEADLERFRSRAANRGTHLSKELLDWWRVPALVVPQKLLLAWALYVRPRYGSVRAQGLIRAADQVAARFRLSPAGSVCQSQRPPEARNSTVLAGRSF